MHKEVENFLRIAILIIQYIKSSLISLVDLDLNNKSLTFEQFINQHQHDIYHLCFNRSKCCQCPPGKFNQKFNRQLLHQPQLKDLFDDTNRLPGHVPRSYPTYCCCFAIKGISTKNLDVTLARTLLVNFCKDVFWFSCTTAKHQTLEDFLNQNKHVIYHLWRYNMKCCQCPHGFQFPSDTQLMDQAQWNTIFTALLLPCIQDRKRPYSGSGSVCAVSATPGIQLQHLNASLQDAIIRFCCPLKKTVDVFIEMRNIRYAHIKDATIPDDEYTKFKADIEKGILEIASITGSESEVKHALQDLEQRKLDETLCAQYQTSLLSLICEKDELKTAIESQAKVTSSLENRLKLVEESLEMKETSKRSRLTALTETEIDNHLDEQTFVATKVITKSVEVLEKNSCLLVTGAAGTGKSRNCLEILHQFRKRHPEFNIIKLTKLQDFEDIAFSSDKIVILFEDIFGRTNYRCTENVDTVIIDRLQACVKKGNIKIIFTIRDTIKMSCDWLLASNQCFYGRCEINLSSEEYKMTNKEKENLLVKYLNANNFEIRDYDELENYQEDVVLNPKVTVKINKVTLHAIVQSDPILGFPEACSLFAKNRTFTRLGLIFFKHPSRHLTDEIEKLRKKGKDNKQHKMWYITLLYILVNEDLLDINSIDIEKCLDLMKSCYTGPHEILECDIKDAATEMIGRYLTQCVQDGKYKFQHQTVLESVLFSYSNVDQKIVLSMLNFDFIRELVRLQYYQVKEGEVVLRVASRYYKQLAQRIIEIVHTPFFQRSLLLNMQLLCDSQIVRQDDNEFIHHLIETSHEAYFSQNNDFFTYIFIYNETKSVKFYFPTEFMKNIVKQKHTKSALQTTLQHISNMLGPSTNHILRSTCECAITEAFLEASAIENNELNLDCLLATAKESSIKEDLNCFFGKVFDKGCVRFPHTTMKWIIEKVIKGSEELFDLQQILNQACEFKRLDIVELLCYSFDKNDYDFTEALIAAINNVWKDPNQAILEFIITHVDNTLIDMAKVMRVSCDTGWPINIRYLLKAADNALFDMEAAILQKLSNDHTRKTVQEFIEWLVTNVPKSNLDLIQLMNLTTKFKLWEVMMGLFDKFGSDCFDMTKVIKDITQFHSNGDEFLRMILEKVDHKTVNWNNVLNELSDNGHFQHVKLLLSTVDHGIEDYSKIMVNACTFRCNSVFQYIIESVDDRILPDTMQEVWSKTNSKPDDIKWMIENIEIKSLNLKEVKKVFLRSCAHGNMDTAKLIIEKCNVIRFDSNTTVAADSIDFYCNLNILKWLSGNDNDRNIAEIKCHLNTAMDKAWRFDKPDTIKWLLKEFDKDLFDLHMAINKACERDNIEIVKLILNTYGNANFDFHKVMNKACRWNGVHIVSWLLEEYGLSWFDPKTAMNDASKCNSEEIIKLLLEKYDNELFDIEAMVNMAYEYKSTKTIKNVCHSNAKVSLNTVLVQACEKNDTDKVQWLLINDKTLFDLTSALQIACKRKSTHVMTWLLRNVDSSHFDLKIVMKNACTLNRYDVVEWLLKEKSDISLFEMKTAMDAACDANSEDTVDWLLRNTENSSFDLKKVMNKACKWSRFDLVRFLMEKNKTSLFDLKGIMKLSVSMKSTETIKWLLKNVDNSLFDLEKVLNVACRMGRLDIVKLILEENNNFPFDLKTAMNTACTFDKLKIVKYLLRSRDNSLFDLNVAMNEACKQQNMETVRWMLQNIDNTLFDLPIVIKYACRWRNYGIVKLLLQNNENSRFDLETVMEYACRCSKPDIYRMLIENNDILVFDLKTVMYYACRHPLPDIVTLLLENNDNILFDLETVMYYACRYRLPDIVKLLLENNDNILFDLETVMDNACRYRLPDIVKLLLENNDDILFDLETVMDNACRHHLPDIVKLLLENNDNILFDLEAVMDYAREYNFPDIVILLLENNGNLLFDFNSVIKHACLYRNRNIIQWLLEYNDDPRKVTHTVYQFGDLETMKWVFENTDKSLFDPCTILTTALKSDNVDILKWLFENNDKSISDLKTALNTVNNYGGSMKAIRWLLENIDNSVFDLNTILTQSCRLQNLDIVKLLLVNNDKSIFDLKTAMNRACENMFLIDGIKENVYVAQWLLENIDNSLFDLSRVLIKFCESDHLDIVKLLLKNNHMSQFDLKTAMSSACNYGRMKIVTWMLESIDHSVFDLSMILTEACTRDDLDVVKLILMNNDKSQFDLYTATNTACNNGSNKIVTWVLTSIDNSLFDQNTVLAEACKRGSLDIVKLLLGNNDKSFFDLKTAMNIACDNRFALGRINKIPKIVEWLLENIDISVFDINRVLTIACEFNDLDIVKMLLVNNDKSLFDLTTAINKALEQIQFNKKNEQVVQWLLENNDNSLFDLNRIFILACKRDCLDIVKMLLKNNNKLLFDMKTAMQVACMAYNSKIEIWLLKNIDNSLFDLETVWSYSIETVKWLLGNKERSKIDLKRVMNEACERKRFDLVKWLLQNYNYALFDKDTVLFTLFDADCEQDNEYDEEQDVEYYDDEQDVEYYDDEGNEMEHTDNEDNEMEHTDDEDNEMEHTDDEDNEMEHTDDEDNEMEHTDDEDDKGMENTNHQDINRRVYSNNVYSYVHDKGSMGEHEDGNAVEVLTINENKDNNAEDKISIEEKDCYSQIKSSIEKHEDSGTQEKGNIDKYEDSNEKIWEINTIEDDKLVYDDNNERCILKLLRNENIFDYDDLLNRSCSSGYIDVVKWLLDHCDHGELDIDKVIRHLLHLRRSHTNKTLKYILKTVHYDLLDLTEFMKEASRIGRLNIVEWLLSHTDINVYDIRKLFSEMCRHGKLRLVIRLWKSGDRNTFDLENALNKACSGVETVAVVRWLLREFSIEKFELQHAMLNACRWGNTKVVRLLLDKFDHTCFNMKEALNTACSACSYSNLHTVELLLNKSDSKLFDFQQAMVVACVNCENSVNIVKSILKYTQEATLDFNIIIREVCKLGKINIVQFLVENADAKLIKITEILEHVINMDVSLATNTEKQNSDIGSKKCQLILSLLKRSDDSLLDVNSILISACQDGWLEVVEWLWNKSDKQLLQTREGINEACKNARYNIVKWALHNIEKFSLDVKTIMEESCASGWLDIVQWLWENSDKTALDMESSMSEACNYCRLDVVKWIVDNVHHKHFDKTALMNDACKYGWLNITNWVIQTIDTCDNDIKTAIIVAITYGQKFIVETLFSAFGPEYFDLSNFSVPMSSQSCCNDVVIFILNNFEHQLLDMSKIMKRACLGGWTEVVEYILKHVPQSKIDWKGAFLNACTNGEFQISKLLLDNIHHDQLDLSSSLHVACKKGWEEIVSLLLTDNVDYPKFDFKTVIGTASQYGETDIIQMILQKVDTETLDVNSIIYALCTKSSNEDLICWILTNVKTNSIDYDSIREKARENEWRTLDFKLRKRQNQ